MSAVHGHMRVPGRVCFCVPGSACRCGGAGSLFQAPEVRKQQGRSCHLLSLTSLQLCRLPSSSSSRKQLFLSVRSAPAPGCQPLQCTCRIKMFSFMYYLCEKYSILSYIVHCVSWLPRLTLLDFGTNTGLTNVCALRMGLGVTVLASRKFQKLAFQKILSLSK